MQHLAIFTIFSVWLIYVSCKTETCRKSRNDYYQETNFWQNYNNTSHAEKLVSSNKPKLPKFCDTGQQSIGVVLPRNECLKRGGSAFGTTNTVCCLFTQYCGGTSDERLINFQSPHYPRPTRGTLACDFELNIKADVCAVRIDFIQVQLFGKLGGVCDVDQILILNSVDGPTSAQCGDLSGYTTTVAVKPGQKVPLKIVLILQNEGYYLWQIRLGQIRCSNLKHFRRPAVCGSKEFSTATISFYQMLDLWRNSAWYNTNQYMDQIWWRTPAPSFNRFYFQTTRRVLRNEKSGLPLHAEDRIVGGSDAELHEFPWQVAIILKRVFFCGGVLINDEYVLSAAHCFLTQETPVADLVVFLGDHDLTSSKDTISDVRGVKRVHFHAHFHALLLSNDIALLQLDRIVGFSSRIRPICLPDPFASVLEKGGIVAGWGITSNPDGKPNAILQKIHVEIMTNALCEAALMEELGAGNLCAMPLPKQGTCFGDSGGPLTIINENDQETLIGIVSFGITGCAVRAGVPDLYTRVSEYLAWIEISAFRYLN